MRWAASNPFQAVGSHPGESRASTPHRTRPPRSTISLGGSPPRLLAALLLLALPSPGLAADAAVTTSSFWPIWGAATIQVAVIVVTGLVLTGFRRGQEGDAGRLAAMEARVQGLGDGVIATRRAQEGDAARVAVLEQQLRSTTDQLAVTREQFVPRVEANERFSRLNESMRTYQADTTREFKEIRAEIKEIRAEVAMLHTDVQKILALLSGDRGGR